MGCKIVGKCSYFVYDKPKKTCKLYTNESSKKICDIIHGTPDPDYNTCIKDGYISWASSITASIGLSSAPSFPIGQASSINPRPGKVFFDF